jgi:predicted 2-oxoglutarate/Fe(II)-dependent dioxygenase YbiX
MLNPKIYFEKIFYYQNIIEKPEEVVYFLENENQEYQNNNGIGYWEKWQTSGKEPYQFGEKKTINYEKIKNSENKTKNFFNKIDIAINKVLLDYKEKNTEDIGEPQSYGISKYFTEKEMGEHVDFNLKSMKRQGNFMFPTVSSVLYLNDDYEGGEIEFPRQKIFIKPSSGSMIVFPSTEPFYHKSNKIISGNKYVVPVFCYKKIIS